MIEEVIDRDLDVYLLRKMHSMTVIDLLFERMTPNLIMMIHLIIWSLFKLSRTCLGLQRNFVVFSIYFWGTEWNVSLTKKKKRGFWWKSLAATPFLVFLETGYTWDWFILISRYNTIAFELRNMRSDFD